MLVRASLEVPGPLEQRFSTGVRSAAHLVWREGSAGVPREFGGKSKRSEKNLKNKKFVEIRDQHYF
jgi:hypothetical protein